MATKDKDLNDLFLDTLKDIYFAEKHILKALSKMAKAAQSDQLRAAFEKHHGETEGQVERLEQIFEMLDKPARGKTCDAIQGILDEGKEIMEEYKGCEALDAGLLVEIETGLEPPPDEAPFDIAVADARGNSSALEPALLASLYRRLRQGGRLILLVPAGGSGVSALLGGGSAPDTSTETGALLAAGFRTARLLATRERIAFVEALKA